MRKNIGSSDRTIRLVLAAVLAYLTYSYNLPASIAWLGYPVALVLLVTALFSFCPLYSILGMSTCRR